MGLIPAIDKEKETGEEVCGGVMMDYREPDEADVILCGNAVNQWERGFLVEFAGVLVARKGPRVGFIRGEVLSTYPFLHPSPSGFLSANSSLSS